MQPLKGHSSLFLYMDAPRRGGQSLSGRYAAERHGNECSVYRERSPPATGEVSVDGVSNTVNVGRGLYLSPWVPSTEAVGEIKIMMGTLPAEYGRAAGVFTNIVIKSGTNEPARIALRISAQLGGGRESVLPARTGPEADALLAPITTAGRWRSGWIPRLYNGRDRTFFFFS